MSVVELKKRVRATHGNGVRAEQSLGDPAGLSLRANFAWTLAGNVVYAGCQWGIVVVFAKCGSPEALGQFSLALAITAPVLMFGSLQLRALLATDAKNAYRFGDYLALRLTTGAAAMLLIAAIAATYRLELFLVIVAVGAAKIVESMSDAIFGLEQKHDRMDLISISMIVKGLASLAMLAGAYYLTDSVVWASLSLLAVWSAVFALYDLPNAKKQGDCRPLWDGRRLLSLAVLGLPLGAVMLLNSLNANVPRYFLDYHFGERELGIFAALSYLATAGAQVTFALGQSAIPRMARSHANGDTREYWGLVVKLIGISLLLGILGIFVAACVGRPLLTVIYGPEYAEHGDSFTIVAFGAAISYLASAFGYAATARRRLKPQPFAMALTVIIACVFCWMLVPGGGVLGASWSLVAGSAALASSYAVLLFAGRNK
jgi:O-antigen/teichoic acid export membrane protein